MSLSRSPSIFNLGLTLHTAGTTQAWNCGIPTPGLQDTRGWTGFAGNREIFFTLTGFVGEWVGSENGITPGSHSVTPFRVSQDLRRTLSA